MKVSELIELLKKQPQDLEVVKYQWSEYVLLEDDEEWFAIIQGQDARPDGWVHDARPDKPVKQYLAIG